MTGGQNRYQANNKDVSTDTNAAIDSAITLAREFKSTPKYGVDRPQAYTTISVACAFCLYRKGITMSDAKINTWQIDDRRRMDCCSGPDEREAYRHGRRASAPRR